MWALEPRILVSIRAVESDGLSFLAALRTSLFEPVRIWKWIERLSGVMGEVRESRRAAALTREW
jgi:hypothetical protein